MSKHPTYQDSSEAEIRQALETVRKELSETRLGIQTQKIKTHATIRKNRKAVARMLTALRAQQHAPAESKEKNDGK